MTIPRKIIANNKDDEHEKATVVFIDGDQDSEDWSLESLNVG